MAADSAEPRASTPLYWRAQEAIRARIRSGEWRIGDRIPSERELMQEFQVSRATVVRAVNDLVRQGVLCRVQGKGTFVSAAKIEQPLTRLYSFAEEMLRQGLGSSTRVLEAKEASCPDEIVPLLRLGAGEKVIKLTRVRLVLEAPIIVETSYLPSKLVPGILERDLSRQALYGLLKDVYGITVARAREYLEAVLADEFAAHHLGIKPGSPLLLCERHAYDSRERAIEVCRGYVRADKYRYTVDLA